MAGVLLSPFSGPAALPLLATVGSPFVTLLECLPDSLAGFKRWMRRSRAPRVISAVYVTPSMDTVQSLRNFGFWPMVVDNVVLAPLFEEAVKRLPFVALGIGLAESYMAARRSRSLVTVVFPLVAHLSLLCHPTGEAEAPHPIWR